MSKLIIGCGYLGGRVARAWLSEQANPVSALTRSEARAESFREQSLSPIVGDVTEPTSLKLPEADTVLFAVGYDRQSPATQTETYVNGLRNVLNALPAARRIIYISSTGVYGQTDDSWVDEESVCEPTREGGKACLEAERLLRASDYGDRSVILRLAGIYGPDRVPNVRDAKARLNLNLPGYLNLIHVEDAVAAVLAAERYSGARDRFLVSDGDPVLRTDYYREVIERFPQSAESDAASASAASRRMGSKRVSNQRMLRELKVKPAYPSYRDGLAAIAAGC